MQCVVLHLVVSLHDSRLLNTVFLCISLLKFFFCQVNHLWNFLWLSLPLGQSSWVMHLQVLGIPSICIFYVYVRESKREREEEENRESDNEGLGGRLW